jgi:hypothetical protein
MVRCAARQHTLHFITYGLLILDMLDNWRLNNNIRARNKAGTGI